MGAAQSSNAAEAVANVSNFVNNSTTANSTAVSNVQKTINLSNCYIKLAGDFDAKESATLAQKNTQIISAKQDTNVANNIQQQMLQQAQSTVGSLGIGYADASNSASEMVNDTNQIVNAMTVGCNQYSSVNQSFTCSGSTIIAKNLNIEFDSSSDFLSSQTLNNDQVANVVNDISQSIQQKATATVEGISGMLIMILLMIAVIIYVGMKPLSSGGAKVIVGVSLCFVFVGVILLMYLRGTPPFFSSPSECINNSSIGMGGNDGNVPNCINHQDKKITLSSPPLKYIYGVTPTDTSQPGGNLVQMVIAATSGQSLNQGCGPNGGYRASTFYTLDQILNKNTKPGENYTAYAVQLGIPMIPNPLTIPVGKDGYYAIPGEYAGANPEKGDNCICTPGTIQVGDSNSPTELKSCPQVAAPSAFVAIKNPSDWGNIVANLNASAWSDYMNLTGSYPPTSGFSGDEATTRALFARFVLCDIIGNIDLHHYVSPNELVKFSNQSNQIIVGLAGNISKTNPDDVYMYHPYSYPGSWSNGVIGPGYIKGKVGVIDDNNYRFQNFMKKIGGYILLGILGLVFIFMFYTWYKNKKSGKDQNK